MAPTVDEMNAQNSDCCLKRTEMISLSPKLNASDVETECINAIRVISAAQPTAAKSGHPGAPIGCAVMAHALFAHVMRYDPKDSHFMGRDRFILSNGHACALLYTMLHLSSDFISYDDLKNFRQLNSVTPGHPEANHTHGVEVTTGPLGQGIAQGVGIAIGQHQYFEKYGPLYDTYTFCIVGDGCLMEGVSAEASSLAGHLGLGRLICLYDSNQISIDGSTDLAFSENVKMRYESYGWQVLTVTNGDNGLYEILAAIQLAQADTGRPSMIIVNTTIGYQTVLAGTAKVHGSPLPMAEVDNLRKNLGMEDISGSSIEAYLKVPENVVKYYNDVRTKQERFTTAWKSAFLALDDGIRTEIVERENFDHSKVIPALPKYNSSSKPTATRTLSGDVLNAIESLMPGLIGGSADLTPSNMTALKGCQDITRGQKTGKYLRFGVREHAMLAICNGLFAHGGFQPFSATFLIFLTYSYPALRLCALSKFSQFFIATHDSIELGEDGPTHQPVEVLPLVRALPNCVLIRPCDGNETSGAYAAWLSNQSRPVVAALSRGNCDQYDESSVENTLKGAYILKDFSNSGRPKIIIAASGTEVQIAVRAKGILESHDKDVRVVSFPSWELFEEQPIEYQNQVFPGDIPHRAYVEASSGMGIERWFNREASTVMTTFGASAPKNDLCTHFGFTPEAVADKIMGVFK